MRLVPIVQQSVHECAEELSRDVIPSAEPAREYYGRDFRWFPVIRNTVAGHLVNVKQQRNRKTAVENTMRRARHVTVHLLLLLLMGYLLTGCATRKDVQLLTEEHRRTQRRLDSIDQKQDMLDAKVDTLFSLLGGNLQANFRDQEELLRTFRAETGAATEEQLTKLEALTGRISDSEQMMDRLAAKLDQTSLIISRLIVLYDTTDTLSGIVLDPNDPENLFNQSYQDYTLGKMELARQGFHEYFKLYPETQHAGNALYWIGETFLAEGQTDSAQAYFRRIEFSYPDNEKMATSLIKRASILVELGRTANARTLYQRVIDDYPATPEARLARNRLQNLQ